MALIRLGELSTILGRREAAGSVSISTVARIRPSGLRGRPSSEMFGPLRTVVLGALAALLISPAHASAAAIPLGSGNTPNLTVDGAGTAYIVYNGAEAGQPPHFCRLPRGATACDVQVTLPVPATTDTLSRPIVVVNGTRVVVLAHRYGQQNAILEYLSTDGGVTFPTVRTSGAHVPNIESVAGPGDSVSVVSSADGRGALFENVPLTAGAPVTAIATLFGGDRPYNGTVGMIDAATPLALFATGASLGAFRRYDGTGDLNDPANWLPAVEVGYVDYPRLAGGPAGLFLIAGDESFGLFVRKWDGTTFGPRVAITANGDDSEMHMFQDAGGRLHAVFGGNEGDGFHVVHAVSDDGVNWQSGTLSVQTDDEPSSMRVAAAPDHVGVAVWSSRVAGVPEIRVSALGPGAPGVTQPPPPPPPIGTPTPTPVAAPVPQFHKTVVLRPVNGTVRVRLKGSKRFVDLREIDDVPLGSTVDTRRGRVELASVPSPGAAAEKVQLYDGQFRVAQKASITEFTLNEALAPCGRRAHAAASKPKSRRLWGNGKGRFRTKGSYSAATVRGTTWLVQDSCAGTLTRVTSGSVLVTAGPSACWSAPASATSLGRGSPARTPPRASTPQCSRARLAGVRGADRASAHLEFSGRCLRTGLMPRSGLLGLLRRRGRPRFHPADPPSRSRRAPRASSAGRRARDA